MTNLTVAWVLSFVWTILFILESLSKGSDALSTNVSLIVASIFTATAYILEAIEKK